MVGSKRGQRLQLLFLNMRIDENRMCVIASNENKESYLAAGQYCEIVYNMMLFLPEQGNGLLSKRVVLQNRNIT